MVAAIGRGGPAARTLVSANRRSCVRQVQQKGHRHAGAVQPRARSGALRESFNAAPVAGLGSLPRMLSFLCSRSSSMSR